MGEKIKWLEKYAPPGIDIKVEVIGYIAGVVVATLQSLSFVYSYGYALGELYTYHGISGKRVLMEGAIIQDFGSLMEGVFLFGVMM